MFLVLSACGNEASNTSEPSSGSNGNTPAETTQEEAVELKLGQFSAPVHVQQTGAMEPFAEEIEKATDGKVKIEIYSGGALGGPQETFDNIVTGIMDIGWGLQGYTAGKFEAHSVLQLPFQADGTAEQLSLLAQKMYDQTPEIQEEYSEVKPLWFHAADSYAIFTKGKAVNSFEDVKGLKLRTPNTEASEMIKAWGATPVSLPANEVYDSLSKGVVDGAVLPIAALKDFNLFDVVDYVTYGSFNTSIFYMAMNKDSWDQLSPENQQIIEEKSGETMAKMAGQAFDAQMEIAEKEAKEAGIEFITLPDAELQKFKDVSKVVTEEWLDKMEKKGIDGQKIYDESVQLLEELK